MAFRDDEAALQANVETMRRELAALVADFERVRQGLLRLERRGGDVVEVRGREAPCPLCGSVRFTWGELRGQGVRFLEADAGWVDRNLALATGIKARRCDDCRCVLAFDA